MIASRWRLRRLLVFEAQQLILEAARRTKQMDGEFVDLTTSRRHSYAFQKLCENGNSLKLILRYEAQLNRSYNKALEQLQKLQANRPPAPPPAPSEDPVGSFGNPPPQPPNPAPPPYRAPTVMEGFPVPGRKHRPCNRSPRPRLKPVDGIVSFERDTSA